MTDAVLIKVDAPRAQFILADMRRANLSAADLREADFDYAQLADTNLWGANLKGANFSNVTGLSCEQLQLAVEWESSHRDPGLACGKDIPKSEFVSNSRKELDKLIRFRGPFSGTVR
jgi:uncharacterized protein YjbI with pentapeptide repeats